MMSKLIIRTVVMGLLVLSVAAYGNQYYPATPPPYKAYQTCPAIGGYASKCRPAEDCSVWYDLVVATPKADCKLTDGNAGICCPDLPYNGNGVPIQQKKIQHFNSNFKLDIATVEKAITAGKAKVTCLVDTQSCLVNSQVVVRPGSSGSAQAFFSRTSQNVIKLSRGALPATFAAEQLVKQFQSDTVSAQQVASAFSQISLRDTSLSGICPANPPCNNPRSPFRTLDGSCNNIANSIWGRSSTQYIRLTESDYDDRVSAPRKAKNWRQGRELPSPRLVSISVVHDENSPSDSTTLWTMQMGQFLDHDLVSTPATPDNITCCTDDGKPLTADKLDPVKCLPISIPQDDPFYSQFGQTCMQFLRSDGAPRLDCRFGSREQMNANTHFLDLSVVYGSDDKTAEDLRTKENGKLKVSPLRNHHEKFLLPPGESPLGRPCSLAREISGVEESSEIKCFNAGDGRSSVTPSMAVSQTVFLREHNRLTGELAKLNPSWNDERLYQEARRILIAQAQHITYNEWLPVVIGRKKMQELGLLPLQSGFSQSYDANLNPAITNEFVAAAFRFGHSLVQGRYSLFNEQRQKVGTEKVLRQHFFRTQEVYTPGNLDKFLISLATTPVQNVDNGFTVELTNHLFEDPAQRFGADLVALNIQRGRDHGIPSYNTYREMCGLKKASNFDDLCDTIPSVIINRFKTLYDSVDDIDLFIAGTSERVAEGALVGPTFQCMIGQQFLRIKRGDRYFYDLSGQAGSFTQAQLDEIRKVSLARLVCDNSRVEKFQPLIFKSVSATNPIVDCKSSSIPSMSLLPWK